MDGDQIVQPMALADLQREIESMSGKLARRKIDDKLTYELCPGDGLLLTKHSGSSDAELLFYLSIIRYVRSISSKKGKCRSWIISF